MTEESVTRFATCPLCEATCGLALDIEGDNVVKVRGDAEDVFSQGFICPKGASIGELHADPDRLDDPDGPPRRRARSGDAGTRPSPRSTSGSPRSARAATRNATAVYLGNPNAHTLDGLIYLRALIKAIGTRNIFSATSVDQLPKQISCALMFGSGLSHPDPRHRPHRLHADPRRQPAGLERLADDGARLPRQAQGDPRPRRPGRRHRPAADHGPRRSPTSTIRSGPAATPTCWPASSTRSSTRTSPTSTVSWSTHVAGARRSSPRRSPPFAPEAVARGLRDRRRPRSAGSPASSAAAPTAAVYARIGTTTQEFGTLASWLVDVINAITGNLDRPGGAMFPLAAAGADELDRRRGRGRGFELGRWCSRVRGMPEAFGELPVACLAEEITEPGEGQVRALITVAGNPLVSTPNSGRLSEAFDSLDLLVSIDCYLNETSSRADVVLPGALAARALALRPRLLPAVGPQHRQLQPRRSCRRIRRSSRSGGRCCGSTGLVAGAGPRRRRRRARRHGRARGRPPRDRHRGLPGPGHGARARSSAALGERRGPERILDLMLRCGPYGAGIADRPGRGNGTALSLGPARGEPARDRPRPAEAAPARDAADRERQGRALPAGAARRPRPARRGARPRARGHRPDRAPRPALEQLLDAQPPPPRPRQGRAAPCTSIPPTPSGSASAEGGDAAVSSRAGSARRPGRGDRLDHGGRRLDPPRLGSRRRGRPDRGRRQSTPGSTRTCSPTRQLVDALSGNAVLNGIPVAVAPA